MGRHPLYQRVTPVIDRLVATCAPAPAAGPGGVIVALSGGPDSVALLLLVRAWAETSGGAVVAAHFDHQLRGGEARADAEFCRQLCQRLEVPLTVGSIDPRHLARGRGLGLEEAGRHLRREQLGRLLAADAGLTCVATGHHRDDQTETVIMRLFRGTGLDGLGGIRPVSGRFIHPLLDFTRRELLEFLEHVGQDYRVDATNREPTQTRNRVRRELLPLARDIFGESATRAPARLAELTASDTAFLNDVARRTLTRLHADAAADDPLPDGTDPPGPATTGGAIIVPVDGLAALERPLARRVVRLLLSDHDGLARDIARRHVDLLLDWIPDSRSGGALDLPHGWRVVREFDLLRFLPAGEPNPAPGGGIPLSTRRSYRILVEMDAGEDSVAAAGMSAGGPDTESSPWWITCPADALQGELRLRPWRRGDRLPLLGLGGHKKVSDLLRERRIGVSDRPGVMVVTDDRGLLWVVGLGRAERTRLLPGTKQRAIIKIVSATEDPPR